MTRMSATTVAQPPAQPIDGPNARVPQMNVVPQSGMTELSSRYAMAVSSIGTNAMRNMAGDFSPTASTT